MVTTERGETASAGERFFLRPAKYAKGREKRFGERCGEGGRVRRGKQGEGNPPTFRTGVGDPGHSDRQNVAVSDREYTGPRQSP